MANYDLTTYQCGLGHRSHFPLEHIVSVNFERKRCSAIYSVRSGVLTVESEPAMSSASLSGRENSEKVRQEQGNG